MYNLVNFPDYSIDTNTGKVFSHKFGKTKEMRGCYVGSQLHYKLPCPEIGREFNASLGRLIASAKYKCSYFKLPKDVMFNWNEADGLTLRTRSENALRGHREREKRDNTDRIAVLDRTVMEMGLIRQAYLGDISPLSLYLNDKKAEYIRRVANTSIIVRGGGKKYIQDIVDDVIYTLLNNISKGNKNIILLEPWIIRTSLALIKHKKATAMAEYNDKQIYKQAI